MSFSLGVDVGGTKTLAVLARAGQVVGQLQVPTVRGEHGVLNTITEVVEHLRVGVPPHEVAGVGIGIPGTVDARSGTVRHSLNVGVHDLALGPVLSDRLGLTVAVENDVNAAALGAMAQLSGTSSLALLNLGTGLAVGIVLEGRLHRGACGVAGEIGHLPVPGHDQPCVCGQQGCLETLISGSAFRRTLNDYPGLSAEHLLVTALSGEDGATPSLSRYFDHLAWAVQIIALAMDVERIVIAGGISAFGQDFLRALKRALHQRSAGSDFTTSLNLPDKVTALPAGSPAGALGAAHLLTTG